MSSPTRKTRGKPKSARHAAAAGAQADGDWRGPYGFGHRAYRPDPDATYVFDPGPPRTLPEAAEQQEAGPAEILWKRPLR